MWQREKNIPDELEYFFLSHVITSLRLQLSYFGCVRSHGLQPARLLCPWGFSRQEYWSGLPCPPPGDLPNLGTEPRSPASQVDSLLSEPPGNINIYMIKYTYIISEKGP